MKATCQGHEVQGSLVIVDTPGPTLRGRDTIKAFNNCEVAMLRPSFVANLNTRKEDRTSQELHTLLKKECKVVSDALDQFVADDVISPFMAAEWATPVVPVVKTDRSIRLCGGFHLTVNKATVTEEHPLHVWMTSSHD